MRLRIVPERRNMDHLVGVSVALLITAMSLVGCDSKQRARDELISRGVTEYSQARFLQAVSEANTSVMNLFLDAGMDANAREHEPPGCTAVVVAIRTGDEVTLKALVGRGADVNAKCADGKTPLVYAAKSGKLWATQLLLDAGANPSAPDKDGLTPLNYSQFLQFSEVSSLLVSHSAMLGKLRNAEMLAIDSSEVAPIPPDNKKLLLTAALRNRSDYPSAFPRLRIGFTDSKDVEIFAIVLQPSEYLKPPLNPDSLWAARSTIDIRSEFAMLPNGSGYRVYVMSFDETLGR